jgi:NAD(P)-dependent dehydrogenase (short-subunit alcohol dehydrogenase family)
MRRVGDDGRICLLTGASGVLGDGICRRFHDEWTIVAVGRSHLPAGTLPFPWPTPALRTSAGPRLFGLTVDLLGSDALHTIVEQTIAHFGEIDVLIHAARSTTRGPITSRSAALDSLEEQLRLNVVIAAELTTLVADRCWYGREDENRRRRRHVLNLSSTAGHRLYPGSGLGAYAAAKAGVDWLTRYQALELAELGVRANALAPNTFPGIVRTSAVLDAIARLDASDETGLILAIDRPGTWALADTGWPQA